MTGWKHGTLADLGTVITGGTPAARNSHWFGDEVPFITPTDMAASDRRARPQRWLSAEGRAGMRTKVLPSGAVCFVCIGATIGKICLTDRESVTNQQINSIVPRDGVDARFLYYLLKHEAPGIARTAGGAATPLINKSAFSSVTVRTPEATTMASVGAMLGALDDLIENNRRRVEVLEEMARAVYREWFVKFRYPGHEGVGLIDSALSPTPEGWALSTCGAELNFIGGGTPSKTEPAYWDEGTVAWYTPTDLTKSGWRYAAEPKSRITEQGVAKSSARLFPAGSVMMTSRATLGVLAIATTEATTNQGFIVLLPDERWSPGFIYEWLDSKAAELAVLGTGATFKEITKGSFKNFPFVVPAQPALDAYSARTAPLEEQIHVLEQQTRKLATLRDLLLPKLVTGQIDVSVIDLDALLEDAVA